jgi:hypothetical protein
VPECFCGCGRRAGFRERAANLAGGETLRMLSSLEDALRTLDPEAETLVETGHVWSDVWAAVVHLEVSRPAVDRDAWVQWRDAAAEVVRRAAVAAEWRESP